MNPAGIESAGSVVVGDRDEPARTVCGADSVVLQRPFRVSLTRACFFRGALFLQRHQDNFLVEPMECGLTICVRLANHQPFVFDFKYKKMQTADGF